MYIKSSLYIRQVNIKNINVLIILAILVFISFFSDFANAATYGNPLKHEPYIQLGNAPLTGYDNGSDQFQIIWQAATTSDSGTDSFTVEYKSATSSTWIDAGSISTITANVGGRVNHYVTIDNLLYDQDYDYRVLHIRDSSTLATYTDTYHTRLEAGDHTPFTFVSYGDSASGDPPTNFISVQDRINTIDPEFSILLGDNVYSDGTHSEWDLRLDRTKNASAANYINNHIDYFGWGNHDIITSSGQPALDNYDSPRIVEGVTSPVAPPVGETDEKNYSFDYGDVHFVTFDTNSYTSSSRLAKQLTWAVADLEASSATWKIVFVHFPLVSISFTSTGPTSNYYQQMVSQLKDAGADLVLAGHAHTYERSYPLTGQSGSTVLFTDSDDNNYAKGGGLPQVVSGLGGRDFHSGNSSPTWLAFGRTGNTSPVAVYGLLKIDVTTNQLTLTQVKASDGSTIDTSYITSGMSSTNVAPASLAAGTVGNVGVSFTTTSAIPADGKIVVTMPTSLGSGYTLDSGGSTSVVATTSIDGVLTTLVSGAVATTTRSGGTSSSPGAKSITLSYIKNPDLTGSTGTYKIKTTGSDGVTIEEDIAVTADTITAGALSSTNVEPTSLESATTTTLTVSLTTTNTLASNGKIVVTLPTSLAGGFTFDNGGTTAVGNITGIDGSLSLSVASNVATLTRTGGSSFSPGAISFTLSYVKNPVSTGSTGVYQIKTTNSSGTTIDENTSVTADTITASPASSWWNSSWDYRIKITLDNANRSENITDVPVMVALNGSRVNYNHILSFGQDIRFVDSDNSTVLSHETERWDTSATSTIWVKVPQIDSASSTDHIYMYYGNDSVADAQSVAAVWSNSYRAVYHFASTTGAYTDSVSAYASNSSDGHTLTSRTTTLLGYAPTFGGTTATFITIPDSDTFNVATNTIEAFIRPSGSGTAGTTGAQSSIYPLVTKGYGEGDTAAQDIQFYLGIKTTGPVLAADFEDSTLATNNAPVTGTTTISTAGSTNYYVSSIVRAGSGGGTHRLYINGGLEQSANLPSVQNGLTPNQSGTQKMAIGVAIGTTGTLNGAFNGMIDEVRLSDVARSADWLSLQNASLRDTLNTYGSAENVLGIDPLTSTSVTPASLDVSASGNVVINFTTSTAIPSDGKIKITFPTSLGYGFTFDSGGATSVTATTSIDGALTTSISDNIVTLTRSGGTDSAIGSKSITLSYIQNPIAAGSTGTYTIRTTDSSDGVLDEDTAVTASTITAGTLSSTNIEPASVTASAAGSATITFSTEHAIPANGKIVITFPTSLGSGFSFNSGGTTVATSHTIGGTLTVGVSSNIVTVTRSNGATTTAGEIESITLSNVANPTSAGSTGTYQIKTTNSATATVDEDTAVTADTIVSTPSSWWNNSWSNRIKITFNNADQGANLVNFPARVALTSSRVTYGTFKANGDDIRFIDADGITELDYEIENWNTASTSNLWVEVPQIDSASSTDHIYMYYGNSDASAVATTTGVWDINYVTVHHFGQSSGTYEDSTLYNHDSGSVTSVTRTSAVTGSIGYTTQLAGGASNSYVSIADSADYDMSNYTIESYIRKIGNGTSISTGTGGQTAIYPVITKGMAEAESQAADIQFFMGVTTGNVMGADFEHASGSQNSPVTGTSTVSNDTWYHVAERFDNTNDTLRIYKGGYREQTTSTTNTPNTGGTQKVGIGTGTKAAGVISAGGGFNGYIDEVRISNIVRAEEWIAASAFSIADSYNTYASEESSGSGDLTSTDVEPASLVASASGNVVVTFTTESAIAADGKIVVTFPTSLGAGFTFNVGGTTAVSASSGIDGTFSAAVSGNVVTITRVNDGASSGAGAKSITLSYIRNPNLTGSTGTYQIKTTNSSGTTVDQDNAVAADTITSSTLSSTNVEPASLIASASTTATVSFTTTNIIPNTGKIVITFPTSLGAGFTLGTVSVSSATGIDGVFTVSTSSSVVTVTRTGTGNGSSAGAKTLVLTGITNPNIGGSTGAYQIKTTTSGGTTIDIDATVTADSILGTLSSTNVEPASLVAGATGNIVLTFTTASALPADGKVVLALPTSLGSGFTYNSGGTTAVSSATGIDGAFTVSVSSNTITLTRANDGASSAAGVKTITLSNIKNPAVPGSTGTYSLYTKTSADVILEQNTSVTADTITTGALSSTNIEPASLVAGATGNATVTFTTANPIPADGRVVVYLPTTLGSGFVIDSNGTTDATSVSGIDGTITVTDVNNFITITRNNDGASSVAGVKTITLSNIKNPDLSGSTGEYNIDTRTSASIAIDTDISVGADTITAGAVSSANIEPATLVAEAVGMATITFSHANPIPTTGKIVLTFPTSLGAGFAFNSGDTSAAVSSTIDGTLTTSISSNVVTITRSGGSVASAGTVETITLTFVKNPNTSGSTGVYGIKTTNSSNITIDEDTSVGSDTISSASSASSDSAVSSSGSRSRIQQVAAIIGIEQVGIPTPLPQRSVVSIIKEVLGLGRHDIEFPPVDVEQLKKGIVWSGKLTLFSPALLNRLIFAPLPNNLLAVLNKFPQLKNTLESVGIKNAGDAIRLVGINFSLPQISDLAGLPRTIPIPIKNLTADMRRDIPLDTVFLRTSDESIEFSVDMTVTDSGEVRQTMDLIEGQEVKLFVKTEGHPERVSGVIELYSKKIFGKTSVPLSALVASAFFANPVISKVPLPVDKKLILDTFEYTDTDGDGIYEASVQMPQVSGQYKVRTLIEDRDDKVKDKEIEIITVIDPEGYIYEASGDQETRINEARVTLFYRNPDTNSFVRWSADKFQQENPQITDKTGRYSFLVPEGTYRIEVKVKGYALYTGEEFNVSTGRPVHQNIELNRPSLWSRFIGLFTRD